MRRASYGWMVVLFLFIFSQPVFGAKTRQSDVMNNISAAFLKRDYEFVVSECNRYLNRNVSPDIKDELYYYKGMAFLKLYKWKDSEIAFKEIIQSFPKSNLREDAYMALGDINMLTGSYEEAENIYKDLLRDYSNSDYKSMIFLKLGNVTRKLGKWDESREFYTKVISDYPESFDAEAANDILREEAFCFTVQVGSFADIRNAEGLCSKLKDKGYAAYIAEAFSPDGRVYRVRVGKLGSREDAVALREQLEREGFPTRVCP